MENKYKNYDTTVFIALIVFISGFINAYATAVLDTSVTYHTGTLMKLGMNLGNFKFDAALKGVITVFVFLTGVFTCEIIRHSKLDFMKTNVIVCIVCTLVTAFVSKVNTEIAAYSLNFFAGIYMNTFVSWKGVNTSTTVMTANLKKFGSSLYNRFVANDSKVSVLPFGLIILCFPIGSFTGTVLTNILGVYNNYAILLITLLLIAIIVVLNAYKKELD